jgi:CRP-like cAMP-binding protein
MSLAHRFFALKSVPPFDRLRDAELALIADVAQERTCAPGAVVHANAEPFRRLYVRLEGDWQFSDGQPAPAVLGVGSLLFNQPAPGAVLAHPTRGARCAVIGKDHFHTICNECPELLLGFLEMKGGVR